MLKLLLGITLSSMTLCAAARAEDAVNPKTYLTPENLALLEKGEYVRLFERTRDAEGRANGHGVVLGLINRPAQEAWNVLLDVKSHPEYMPRVVKTEIYQEEKNNEIGIRETIKIMVKSIQYHVLQKKDEATHTLTWRMDKSQKNDIADTSGYWTILPKGDNQCVAVYSVYVDSGLPVPQFVEDFLSRKDLPDVVDAVKKRTESLAAAKK